MVVLAWVLLDKGQETEQLVEAAGQATAGIFLKLWNPAGAPPQVMVLEILLAEGTELT